MAIREVCNVLKCTIVQGYANIFKDEKTAKSAKSTIALILIVAAVFGGFHLYRYYVASKEGAAQQTFMEIVKEFENAERGGETSWSDVEIACELAYRNNSSSHLAPFFLAYKAKVLHKQGKYAEAVTAFDEALQKMDPKSEICWIYKTEFAAMKLGMEDKAIHNDGLSELEKIACLSDNGKKDNAGTNAALYYLATYYWDKDNLEKSNEIWTKLAAKEGDSPYITLAKDKLKQ